MGLPLILSCVWVLLAVGVAFLPIRWQIVPGFILLVFAAVLLVWLARDHGAWIVLPVVAALLSMFRRPIAALLRLGLGSHSGKGGQGDG